MGRMWLSPPAVNGSTKADDKWLLSIDLKPSVHKTHTLIHGRSEKESHVGADWDDRQAVFGNVIVIEDEPVVRMLLQEMLMEIGFTSSAFENAVQALTYFMHLRGDCSLIIADQGLPGGIQGSEFIRMAHKRWPSIPSILTSGYHVDVQDIPSSATYLHKPYTLAQLEQTILPLLRLPPKPLN